MPSDLFGDYCTVVHKRFIQPEDYYVGRPSIFGNPFRIGVEAETREQAISMFREYFHSDAQKSLRDTSVKLLKGRRLACHCAPLPCHAQIIADYVNTVTKGDST